MKARILIIIMLLFIVGCSQAEKNVEKAKDSIGDSQNIGKQPEEQKQPEQKVFSDEEILNQYDDNLDSALQELQEIENLE